MRICFFSGDIGRSGGTERVTAVIASALAEAGHNVSILSLSRGQGSFFPIHPTVRLHSLHMEFHSANLSDWKIWWRLRIFIKEERIERLIDVDTGLSWYSIVATWRSRTKVISWEHFYLFTNVGDIFQRLRRSIGRRMASRWAYKLVTLTENDRQHYLTYFPCRAQVVVILNPVTVRSAPPSDLNSNTVLAAGRLVPEKGFDLLLAAWEKVSLSCSEWKLRIVGSGPDELKLRQLAQSLRIQHSIDFVANTRDIVKEYCEASLFVCSSRFEGLPLVLIEAKSLGLPIISFKCGGPSFIVRNGIDGLLVPPGDISALASALLQLMKNEEQRRAMGEIAREDRRFDLAEIVQAWERVLA